MAEMLSVVESRRQLERVLADPLFRGAQRLAGFLRFVVVSGLEGRAHELKEHTIGVHVFERPANYSPQEDPIVRIMAGRLRAKLAEYYQGTGRADRVLIELPRGGYVPKISSQTPHQATPVRPANPHSLCVGRGREMELLRKAFSAVTADRQGRMAGISGDAGMGKTTLAEEFAFELEEQGGVLVGRAQCSERLAEADAMSPILEILERIGRSDPHGIGPMLRNLAPSWQALIAPPGSVPLPKTASQERMRRELAAFFEEVSKNRPVVLLLDDVHWADATTCDLLSYLMTRSRGVRLLLVATYRPGSLAAPGHPFLPLKLRLEGRGICQAIPLSFLSKPDVDTHLALRFSSNEFPPDFGAVVYERTEGNPLFLSELLQYLQDKQCLVPQPEGIWKLVIAPAEIRSLIPAGVHAMIGLKMQRLEERDRAILLMGAVQGMQFDSAVVAESLGFDPSFVEERLRELEVVHRIVSAVKESDEPGQALSIRYRFIHVFYQSSLYSSLTPSRRTAQSLTVAAALEKHSSGGAAADLAILYETGRNYASAARHFVIAARNTAKVFAYPEAVLLCNRGLKALAVLPESRERDEQELSLCLTLGMALMSTKGYAAPEVLATYRRARDLCLQLNNIRRLIPVLWAIHTAEINSSRLPQALEVAYEMRRAAETLQDSLAIVESLHAEGTTLAFLGRYAEARVPLERIFDVIPVAKHEFRGSLYVIDPLVTSLGMLARLLMLLGEFDRAMERALEGVELANRLTHPHSLCYATFWIGWLLHAGSDYAEALPQLDSAVEMARAHELPLIVEWARVVRGSAIAHLGRREEGIAEMRKSIARQDAMGSKLERGYCLNLLAEALLSQGLAHEAAESCQAAFEFAERTEGRDFEPETRRIHALAQGALGFAEQSQAGLVAALQQAELMGCRLLELRSAMSLARSSPQGNTRMRLQNLIQQLAAEPQPACLTQARAIAAD